MTTISPSLMIFMNLYSIHATQSRRFDARLSQHSINLTEFMILFHLHEAVDQKLRRIDLADRVGLTASAITRLLAPMEKIGLVVREANARDARVSLVRLTPVGKRVFEEARTTAEFTAEDILPATRHTELTSIANLLKEMGGHIQ